MPSQTFTAAADFSSTSNDAWARLQDPSVWGNISGVDEVSSPRFENDELVDFTFYSSVGANRYRGTAHRVLAEKPIRVRWEISTTEIKGWIEVELGSERVEISMNIESVSFMASIGFPLISGAIASGFQQAVDNFAALLHFE